MAPKTLSPSDASQIQQILSLARQGKATLAQLAVAHDLAANGTLNGCLGEIRAHIRRMVSPHPLHGFSREFAVGIASGIATQFLLSRYANRS